MNRLLFPSLALLIAAITSCTAADAPASDATGGTPGAGPADASKRAAPSTTESSTTTTSPPARPPVTGTGGPASQQEKSPQPATTPPSNPKPGSIFTDAPDRDLYQLAAELKPGLTPESVRLVTPAPSRFEVGRVDTFWLTDLAALQVYQSEFELRLVSNNAYWYVERGLAASQRDLERSAKVFEEDIYPRVTSVFGKEWSPGVDNDPHLNILNADIKGVGGYYSSSDEHPASVSQFSNQREIVYMNAAVFAVGTPSYHRTLAHELQHVIHWNGDGSEETWVNEGLAELAVTVAGYTADSVHWFLQAPPTSLVNWPLTPGGSGANYGGASLFMHYLFEHYPTPEGLQSLVKGAADGIDGIDSYLEDAGYNVGFRDIFRDWAVANFLDQPQGVYGYSELQVHARVQKFIDVFSEFSSRIPQYSMEYVQLSDFSDPIRLRFRGQRENSLLPVDVGPQGCWWSNAGDSINSTLTRTIDLRGLRRATLSYQLWYIIEDKWDYAYVEVSLDGGKKWRILEAPHTSAANPVGNSFGMGYTGDSGGWLDETVDLTEYVGREILLRFQYVTDDAKTGAGLCLRQISVPEAGLLQLTDGWQPEGFILIDNRVPQDYIVQVIEVSTDSRVRIMPLDGSNAGELVVQRPQDLDRLVVVVAAIAPKTLQHASYSLVVEPVNHPSSR